MNPWVWIGLIWTQVWQITIVGVIILAVVGLIAKNRPHLGHVLWALVLIKCLIPPIFSSPISPFSWMVATTSFPSFAERAESSNTIKDSETGLLNKQPDDLQDLKWQLSNAPGRPEFGFDDSANTNPGVNSRTAWSNEYPWGSRLFWTWLGSILVVGLWFAGRYASFSIWLAQAHCIDLPQVEKIAHELRAKLKVVRSVRLRILESPIGPAVVGLWKPTILLPRLIAEKLNEQELRTLVAHEMIHIRRGDLFWSFLQMIAKSIWWFHPMVWIASRKLGQESERSCDEETITSLHCDVGMYARCLIRVLEEKHQLHIAPTLPGVRPVQITVNRLERIMKIGHGGYDRNPKWLWGVLLILGLFFVPGAQKSIGQQEPKAKALDEMPAVANTASHSLNANGATESKQFSDQIDSNADDQTVDPAPSYHACDRVAVVGSESIFVQDLVPDSKIRSKLIESGQLELVLRKTLCEVVHCKVLAQRFISEKVSGKSDVERENIEKTIAKQTDKIFFAKVVPMQMKMLKCSSRQEYVAKLADMGESINTLKTKFTESTFAQEYLRENCKDISQVEIGNTKDDSPASALSRIISDANGLHNGEMLELNEAAKIRIELIRRVRFESLIWTKWPDDIPNAMKLKEREDTSKSPESKTP